MEVSSPPPSWPLADEAVRLAISPSTPTAPLPVSRSSSLGEMGLAGGGPSSSSSTSMERVCSLTGGGLSHGAP